LLAQRVLLPLYDVLAVNASYWLAVWMVNYTDDIAACHAFLWLRSGYVTLVFLGLFFMFRLYHSLWKYAGTDELAQCAGAAALGVIVCSFADYALSFVLTRAQWFGFGTALQGFWAPLPVAVLAVTFLLIVMFCCGVRLGYRVLRRSGREFLWLLRRTNDGARRVMVVGAGNMGNIVLGELRANAATMGRPVVVVDDDRTKQGRRIYGVPISGGCDQIPALAARHRVNEILLCIPSLTAQRERELMDLALQTGCKVKITPSLLQMKESDGTVPGLGQFHDLRLEDLLMRPQVRLDQTICAYLNGQTVLVTGGGGSIGSELCRQAARYHPARIVIADISESSAYALKVAMNREYYGKLQVDIRIVDVRDKESLAAVFAEAHPTIVFHAAAHKHVPLMEDAPCEAVKNNIFGTLNAAELAIQYDVHRFVLLSTDKAVNPTSVMGATKRVTELILQGLARRQTRTRFSAVRFGNVLGSSGSVIPLFREQIRAGGPLTVTHPDITRYFMSIPEAAQLVVQVGGISRGGEIFVLEMGEPVKILRLAEQMIRLSGLRPYVDIGVEIVGLRPGEKLHEELVLAEEDATRQSTQNKKINIIFPAALDDAALDAALERLRHVTPETVRAALKSVVENYCENR
jgi:FlaA1/EpsC-like NDP-sugar epimerase